MTAEQQPIDGAIAHPPVMPGIVIPPRSSWPTVMGVIAIVFGAAATLQGIAGALVQLILPSTSVFRGATGGVDMFAGMEQWRPWLLAVNAGVSLLGALLLFGGVWLTMRRRSARGLIMCWAVAKIALVCLSSYIGYQVGQAQMTAVTQSGVNVPVNMGAMMPIMNIVGVVFGIAWGWMLPVFMLIWLMRRKIRNETASWA